MSYFTSSIDERIINILKDGGIGLLPTDTIYGISALASYKSAVERVRKIKRRDFNKPLIVLIGNINQLNDLGINSEHAKLANRYWPAPLTIAFNEKLSVRMPAYVELCELINQVGPIISTSANLQGQEPAKSAAEAKIIFGNKLDFYVDAGKLESEPSTLVEIQNGKLKVIRHGVYKI